MLSRPAVIAVVVNVLAACGWSQAQPTLVLEVRHVTRGRRTEEAFARAQAVAFTAAVSMAVERAAAWPADVLREGGGVRDHSGVGAGDVERGLPSPPPQTDSIADGVTEWFSSEAATAPESNEVSDREGLGCDAPALCAWAQSAEESAFAVATSWPGLDP